MEISTKQSKFMKKAIRLAEASVAKGGGPFGAVIVKDGVVVAQGHNCVTLHNDPTAHAEVTVIRKACKKIGSFDLSGCEIYTSCEPCPMCLAAIYWARIGKIYYGCTKDDAKDIGFDDSFIYDQIDLKPEERAIPTIHLMHKEALSAFRLWDENENKINY